MNMHVATPCGFEPDKKVVAGALELAVSQRSSIKLFHAPHAAVKGADVVYTDVWTSMGQEKEAGERRKLFSDFQINRNLLKLAKRNVLVMHCLPAHRGEEITADVIDSPDSVVFDQAENRMHVQKAILIRLLALR
jgi:ornithine carbamoyltransferase